MNSEMSGEVKVLKAFGAWRVACGVWRVARGARRAARGRSPFPLGSQQSAVGRERRSHHTV